MNFFWVFVGGGLGSLCRYGLSLALPTAGAQAFAWATFGANLIACFILGLFWGYLSKQGDGNFTQTMNCFVLTGFCGGFSTFSTFSKESLVYFQAEAWGYLAAYVILSLILGMLLVFVGWKLGSGF
jgi:CrcB protein